MHTPGSMNSLFSDFFREFWRGISGGVRDYLGEMLGGFWKKNKGIIIENYTKTTTDKVNKIQNKSDYIKLNSPFKDQVAFSV